MHFNWLTSGDENLATKRACIDMEYSLRPKITRFLLKKIDGDFCSDFSCFYFDVDLKRKWVWISEKTPMEYIKKMLPDFDTEINGTNIFSVA
ncbi:hypothetical protein [Flagellimonas pelagia]|uniref:Uncharacterized protein n=1 Tax=Flagellimonas pelagia TaxID=2306998 RepID=A0A3A1NNQ5_9FLAO|nr:hypothetical protein [Allomuricauda maritima]RIV46904.1 hypothetical protein D2V05_02800 [Allomuricauda maritima]TXJ99793.1 hypothetical protein FQ017_02790 [Allomuricauda maritima]